ncbi:uncharacterized protein [Phyllobates terribilis]|uniref:uncharacterized protein n=1 Tax=Phyllobates terribilis TaxID=111132 RepID=UPI003CCB5568
MSLNVLDLAGLTDARMEAWFCRELYRIMEFVRNMERRRLIKPQDILATLQSIPEDESESELQEHVFDSDSDEDFIPQNISSESEDSEGTNPEDIPSTSTGDRAHAVMLPRDHPPGRGQKKSAKRPRNERTTDNDGGEGNATTNTREGESEGILVSADSIQWKPVEIGEHLPDCTRTYKSLQDCSRVCDFVRTEWFAQNRGDMSDLESKTSSSGYWLVKIENCRCSDQITHPAKKPKPSDGHIDGEIKVMALGGKGGKSENGKSPST